MRVVQPTGTRGSLKWIQRAIAAQAPSLEQPILSRLRAKSIDWRSPIATDDFAEYRDGSFLDCLDLAHIRSALSEFWPSRGPQWDALGLTDRGDVLLVEAKAHVRELCSPGSQATGLSRSRIAARLDETAQVLSANIARAPWIDHFYQLANRLAHLHFLRSNGVPAWLVLVNFIGDADMAGPISEREWLSAYQVAWHVMGIGSRHPLSRYVIEVFPAVGDLS